MGKQPEHGADADYHDVLDFVIALDEMSSEEEADAYLNWLAVRAKKLIELRWYMVETLAAELFQHRELSAKRVRETLQCALTSRTRGAS